MKLYIPEIGDEFVLTSDWSFELFEEHRNTKAIQRFVDKKYNWSWGSRRPDQFWNVTLPKGTSLKVDRIYIRKGAGDYSSLTFWMVLPGEKKKIRFWAKLYDVNKIEFEEVKQVQKIPNIYIGTRDSSWDESLFYDIEYSPKGSYVDMDKVSRLKPPRIYVLIGKEKCDDEKHEIEVTYDYNLRLLSKEEKKMARSMYNHRNKGVTHEIDKFSIKAVHVPTGTVITEGRIGTKESLKKKIKEFYLNHKA